jgi:DNA/RNA-binding domain of Phe-tRNA-synthetase-like protein
MNQFLFCNSASLWRSWEFEIVWKAMNPPPFEVKFELEGWRLFWAHLEAQDCDAAQLASTAAEIVERVRSELQMETLSSHPVIAGLRRLFKAAGCDPTRYRPSSEALIRRLLKGEAMPVISPLVDLNNCLSARLLAPCCVMAEGTVQPPYVLRAGRAGEHYESLRGPFNLEGKPLLVDAHGPCDVPITGNTRVKVTPATRCAWLVAYLPAEALTPEAADLALAEIVAAAPAARILLTAAN